MHQLCEACGAVEAAGDEHMTECFECSEIAGSEYAEALSMMYSQHGVEVTSSASRTGIGAPAADLVPDNEDTNSTSTAESAMTSNRETNETSVSDMSTVVLTHGGPS